MKFEKARAFSKKFLKRAQIFYIPTLSNKLFSTMRSDIQAGKRGQKKKKNEPFPNFCMGLRIDPMNMFQVFWGSFLRRKKLGPSETQFAQIFPAK